MNLQEAAVRACEELTLIKALTYIAKCPIDQTYTTIHFEESFQAVFDNWRKRPNCKGDWLLGTAYGQCPRCQETAPAAIKALKDETAGYQEKLSRLLAVLPRGGYGFDISDNFKLQCFEEARRVAYGED